MQLLSTVLQSSRRSRAANCKASVSPDCNLLVTCRRLFPLLMCLQALQPGPRQHRELPAAHASWHKVSAQSCWVVVAFVRSVCMSRRKGRGNFLLALHMPPLPIRGRRRWATCTASESSRLPHCCHTGARHSAGHLHLLNKANLQQPMLLLSLRLCCTTHSSACRLAADSVA